MVSPLPTWLMNSDVAHPTYPDGLYWGNIGSPLRLHMGLPTLLQLHQLNAYYCGKSQSGVCVQGHGRAIAAAWLRTDEDNICLESSPRLATCNGQGAHGSAKCARSRAGAACSMTCSSVCSAITMSTSHNAVWPDHRVLQILHQVYLAAALIVGSWRSHVSVNSCRIGG